MRPHQRGFARAHRDRRGSAMVEMAFIAPVFFAFIFGIMELSRIYWVQSSLRIACQEGCRAGAVRGVEASEVEQTVSDMLAATIDPSLVRISVKDASVYDTSGPYPHEADAAGGFSCLGGFDAGNPLSEMQPGSMFVVYAEVDYEDVTYLPLGTLARILSVASNSSPQTLFCGLTFDSYAFARHE